MDIFSLWPNTWPASNMGDYGVFGDYIGGVWGTLISAITTIFVFLTWRISVRANNRNAIIGMLAEMLKTHDEISSTNSGNPSRFLREFSAIYKISKRIVPEYQVWSVNDRIDISYTYAFYGPNSHADNALHRYDTDKIKKLHDEVARLRSRTKGKYKDLFIGHQAAMSHYMRNLFSMYILVDHAKLNKNEKKNLTKIIRSKLSNYDQAILAMNIISHLGREWETEGILLKYKPIANIPEKFFGVDDQISLKKLFQSVEFEWERSRIGRPAYHSFSVGRFTFTVAIAQK